MVEVFVVDGASFAIPEIEHDRINRLYYDHIDHLLAESTGMFILAGGHREIDMNPFMGWPIPRIDFDSYKMYGPKESKFRYKAPHAPGSPNMRGNRKDWETRR